MFSRITHVKARRKDKKYPDFFKVGEREEGCVRSVERQERKWVVKTVDLREEYMSDNGEGKTHAKLTERRKNVEHWWSRYSAQSRLYDKGMADWRVALQSPALAGSRR